MNLEHVILLHGLCRSSRSMRRMERALLTQGYSVANVDYPSRARLIEDLSEHAVGASLAGAREKGARFCHFVTHSMGGILVRDYMARHPSVRIGRVVMLGPPNRGSEVVDRLRGWSLFRKLNGPAGSQLGTDPDSLPNRLGPVQFELGVIAGRRSINLINSCLIVGPDDGKVSVERTKVSGMKEHIVVNATHPCLMRNSKVIDLTIKFLKYGAFGVAVSPGGNP